MENVTLASERLVQSGLLSEENNTALTALSTELIDTWEKKQVFRTETEMRISVLNDGKFPSNAAKYWQCVREQSVMLDNLATLGFEYRRSELKIRRLKGEIAHLDKEDLDLEEAHINLDEAIYRKAVMQQTAQDRMREIKQWSVLKAELDDGTFDTKNVNTHQLDSYIGSLENRKRTLTSGSSQAEVLNVVGPLETAKRLREKDLPPTEQTPFLDYRAEMGPLFQSIRNNNEILKESETS